MKKLALISTLSIILTACGGTDPLVPTPTPSTMATVNPRCFMSPAPRPEEGIICPGGNVPLATPTRVTNSPVTVTPSTSPAPSTTAHDTSCLTGVWLVNAAEITNLMAQTITVLSPIAISGDIQYKFMPDKSFTEHFNDVVIQFEKANPMNSTPDRHEMRMSGVASGRIDFDRNNDLVITGVSLGGVSSTYTINGENILVGGIMSLGGLVPVSDTKIGVSCGSGFMTLSYLVPERPATIRLIRQ